MAVALILLLVALGGLLYRDRDFWFPEPPAEEADADQPAETAAVPAAAAAQPRPAEKAVTPAAATTTKPKHTIGPASKGAVATKASTAKAATAKVPAVTASKDPASGVTPSATAAPPMVASATRTVLPPLEVEVVAGDSHSTVRPGSNSVRVDLKPGSPPQPATAPSAAANSSASVTTSAVERVQMSADIASAVTHTVKPGYPLLARQMKVQGSVVLQALISKDGVIQQLHVLSGPQILAAAAQDAVRQWHFKPHYVGNEAVETQAKITVNFTISTN
jgi:protein TonB